MILILFLRICIGNTQNYIKLSEVSGTNISNGEMNQLEVAATALIEVLPANVKNEFKVYHVGLYLHNSVMMSNEINEIWQKTVEETALKSRFYLLFGREINSKGQSNFRYSYKLPETNEFECFDNLKREVLISLIEKKLIGDESKSSIFKNWVTHEINFINAFKLKSIEIIACCTGRTTCGLCEAATVDAYLTKENFLQFTVLTEQNTSGSSNAIINSSIRDISDVYVKINNHNEILGNYLSPIINQLRTHADIGLFVTSDITFCLKSIEELEVLSEEHEHTIWIHLSDSKLIDNQSIKIVSSSIGFQLESVLLSFLYKKLNIGDVIFESGNNIENEINLFFENFSLPTGNTLTPDEIAEIYWKYQKKVDMKDAPTWSSKNTLEIYRNGPYFWKKRLEMDESEFSTKNKQLISINKAPIVDDEWIMKNPTHAPSKGQKLIHHHIYHGSSAVGIPEGVHRTYSDQIHYITRKESNFTKGQKAGFILDKLRKMNRNLGLCGLFLNIIGIIDGNPESLFTNFRAPRVGLLSKDIYGEGPTTYCEPISIYHQRYQRNGPVYKVINFISYVEFAWSTEENKYVGLGKAFVGTATSKDDGLHITVDLEECLLEDSPTCIELKSSGSQTIFQGRRVISVMGRL